MPDGQTPAPSPLIRQWLDTRTVADPLLRTRRSELYADFREWLGGQGLPAPSAFRFYVTLEHEGYVQVKSRGDRMVAEIGLPDRTAEKYHAEAQRLHEERRRALALR